METQTNYIRLLEQRIGTIEQHLNDVERRGQDEAARLHGRVTDLTVKLDNELKPINARQNQLVGISGLVALVVGSLLTKAVEALTSGHHPP